MTIRRLLRLFILAIVSITIAIVLASAYVVLTDKSDDLNDSPITADVNNVPQDNVEDCNSKQAVVTKAEDKNQKQEIGVDVGIVTDITHIEGIPLTVVDGIIQREGQNISGVKIVKINTDSVEFECDGNQWSQRIKEPPPKHIISKIKSRILPKHPSVEDIVKYVSPAVVTISINDDYGEELAFGSGFFIGDGKILTNAHVVEGAYSAEVYSLDNIYYYVTIDKRDDDLDLAVLSVQGSEEPPISLAEDTNLVVGQPVLTIGNPKGLERTVSDGLISAIRDWDGVQNIQITAPISHGSSGGPLLNMQGSVIGVTYAGIEEGQNLNFAIGIDTIKKFLQTPDNPEQLKGSGDFMLSKVVRKWLKYLALGIVALAMCITLLIYIPEKIYRFIKAYFRRKKYRLQRLQRKALTNRHPFPAGRRKKVKKVYSSSRL
jgi:S1-C subfamily serine protease